MTEREMLFAKSIRTLLAKTFVVREKNEKIYNFCRNEANKTEINLYLERVGYYIAVDGVLGVVQLKNTTELENEMGVRSDNLYSFNALEQLYLMLFRQYYDEHPYEHPVVISRTAFLEQVLSYAPNEKKTTYTNTLKKLRYFNIISYTESKRAIDDFNITILPSIVFAIDEKRLETLLEEFESGVDNPEGEEVDESETISVEAVAAENMAHMENSASAVTSDETSNESAVAEPQDEKIIVTEAVAIDDDDDDYEYDEEKEESDYEPDEEDDEDDFDEDEDDDDYDWDAEEDNSEDDEYNEYDEHPEHDEDDDEESDSDDND